MARKKKKPLAFARGERRAWPNAALWFHADPASVEWHANPGEEIDPLTVVGDSSMISVYDRTWDFDGRNTMRAMQHYCGPRPNIVDRGMLADLVHPWLDVGDSFELRLVTKPSGKITSETWLSDPLDLALICFPRTAPAGSPRI